MSNVEFEADEVEDLRDVLDSAISDLGGEIADTDNPEYRRALKARRARLISARGKLEPS
jgi:hypothetical protein